MKKVTFLFLIFALNVTIIFAQGTDRLSWERAWPDTHLSELAKEGALWTQVEYKGSPYFSNEFQDGKVFSTTDTIIVHAPLRYNIYSDEIEYNKGDKKIFNLQKSMIRSVMIGDSKFVCKDFSSDKKLCHSYFEVLDQGKATLLKKHRVLFEEAKNPQPYVEAAPAQFKPISPYYYIALGDGEAKQISSNKELIKLLPDKKVETAEFMKKNKLKSNDQDDLKKIFQFYNSEQ